MRSWLIVGASALLVLFGVAYSQTAVGGGSEREQLLDEFTKLLTHVTWDTPIDFADEFFQPGEGFKEPDVPQGLRDYRTLNLLLDSFGVNELPIEIGSVFTDLPITGEVKPLEKLSPAEQRTLLLRFRCRQPFGGMYNAITQLRLIPMMARSGQSELNSIRDTVECERGKKAMVDLREYVSWIHENREKLKDAEYEKWFRENVSVYYTNWVTGGLFEPWHEEFSPGNGLIREITDETERTELYELAKKQERENGKEYTVGFLEENPDAIAYFAYRLYGDKEIIWEGVAWCLCDRSAWGRPLRKERDKVIAILAQNLKSNKLSDEGLKDFERITDRWEWAKSNPDAEWCESCAEGIDERYQEMLEELELAQHGQFPEITKEWSLTNFPLDDETVYWQELTDGEERTLAFRQNISSSFTGYLEDIAATDYETINNWEQLAEVILPNLSRFDDDTWTETASSERAKWNIDQWLSPITRHTFEPWHKEWSRGNGYIAQITDEDMLARLIKLYEKAIEKDVISTRLHPFYYERYPHRLRFYYVRLYGEKEGSIISEGVWCAWPLRPMQD